MIACVVIPNFAIAIHRRDSPALTQGVLILHAAEKVYAASEHGYQAGVEVGMSIREAQLLCSGAHFVRADIEKYRGIFRQVVETLTTFTSLVEPESDLWPTEKPRKQKLSPVKTTSRNAVVYLNLERLRPDEVVRLAETIITFVLKKIGLLASVGLTAGKFPAFVAATSATPGTTHLIPSGQEAIFLADLPVGSLPVHRETHFRLELLGIHTVGQLAALPAGSFSTQFGKEGSILHQLALGRDTRPVIPYKAGTAIHNSRQFEPALNNRLVLEAVLKKFAQDLATQLRLDGRMGRKLELTISLDNGSVDTQILILRRPTANAKHLFETFKEMLAHKPLRSGVCGLEVRLSDFAAAVGEQLELFRITGKQDTALRNAMPTLLARYGSTCFYSVTVLTPTSRLPGRAIRMTPTEYP